MTATHFLTFITLTAVRLNLGYFCRRLPSWTRLSFGSLLLLAGVVPAFPQTTSTDSSSLSSSAPASGMQLLQRAIAAAGGQQACLELTSFRATGDFSLYSGGEVSDSGRATLAGKGLAQFRLTANLQTESRTWILNNGVGLLASQGAVHPIGPHNLPALEGIGLPLQKIIALLNGSSVQFAGSAVVDGKQSYRLRISQTESNSNQRDTTPHRIANTDVLVDAETFAIVVIEDTIFPNGHTRESFSHRIIYADYRPVAGTSIPFSIKEEISGQLTWGLQLTTFEANADVSNVDFELN